MLVDVFDVGESLWLDVECHYCDGSNCGTSLEEHVRTMLSKESIS